MSVLTEIPRLAPAELEMVLSEIQTAVIVLNAGRAIELINSQACLLLGCGPAPGSTMGELLSACGVDIAIDLPEAIQLSTTCRAQLADGRIISIRAKRLSNAGWVLTIDDISGFARDAELARRDTLTGLANRASMEAELAQRLSAEEPFALFFLDLDRFKLINDTLGHQNGDALLRIVAERLLSIFAKKDVVARLGGDEFAILRPGTVRPEEAEVLAARMVDLIGRTYVADGYMMNIGASVGVALAPLDGAEVNILLKNADLAMYRAKEEGRGRFRFFEPSMDRRMQDRRELEISLRRALAMKEFMLVYQPQFQINSDKIVGFEALLRWQSIARGLVPPAAFIPIAEETGLIVAIGEWVIRTACCDAAGWDKSISIAVNVSPLQLRDAKIVDVVMSALHNSGLDPKRLELEITENALLEETDAIIGILHRFRAIGIRIAMDDFGTGYSSLSYLQKFPFDKIKIDQSFIRGMIDNPQASAIVRAAVAIGSSLGIKTIAEGVETNEQLEVIRSEGCCEVQGYLTGRPMSLTAAAALVARPANQPLARGGVAS